MYLSRINYYTQTYEMFCDMVTKQHYQHEDLFTYSNTVAVQMTEWSKVITEVPTLMWVLLKHLH